MDRRWLALIVVILAGLLLVPIVLLALARPIAAPSSSPSVQPPTHSASAGVGITFTDARSPEDAAWYRVGGDPRQFPPHLQVGTMADGMTFDLEMHVDPEAGPEAIVPRRPVLGVGDGVVVMVEDDGIRSVMRAIVAATGEVHDLLVSSDVIANGVLDTDGRHAYYVTGDRLTGDLIGAWRLSVGQQRAPDAIDALVAGAPEIRLVAVTRFFTRMLLSLDGTTLGLFRCLELDCALRAVRTDDGSLVGEVRIARGGGDPFAITGQSALLRPIAPEGPDRIGEVVDLVSEESVPIPIEGWPFGTEAVGEGQDGPVLVLQTAGFSGPPQALGPGPFVPPELTLLAVPDMQVMAEYAPPLNSLRIISEDDYSVGVDLPPGWLLIRGSEPDELVTRAYALNLADGSLVPLPAIGELFAQG